MISVQSLWLTIRDLTRKENIGGYLQNDEFNRQINLCQDILFDHYYDHKNESEARQSLTYFESSALISKSSGVYQLPANYKKKMEAALVVNSQYYPVHFPARDELLMSLSSAVRGPSIERKVVVGKIREADIQIWPDTNNQLFLQYYKIPTAAARAVTVDIGEIEEVYDSGSTVDLEWPADKIGDFVDLMMLFKGVVMRDSSLVQWVQARNLIDKEIIRD